MARNYTQATIKTLFGEASACAYPGCTEPLIFRDRDKATAIADIAHIRSEIPGGPRHDPDYIGDINGPDNLLLLCGKHHRPVDRHESVYSIEELETWKAAQRVTAGRGTPLSDFDLRAYQRLGDEERQSLSDIARLAQRVTSICRSAQREVDAVREAAEQTRYNTAVGFGPMWEIDDEGNKARIGYDRVQLSQVEQETWDRKAKAILDTYRPPVEEAQARLEEEVAVLRMFAGDLTGGGDHVIAAAETVASQVGDGPRLNKAAQALVAAVSQLWRVANGGANDP